jgi:hypothetical protein
MFSSTSLPPPPSPPRQQFWYVFSESGTMGKGQSGKFPSIPLFFSLPYAHAPDEGPSLFLRSKRSPYIFQVVACLPTKDC